MSKYNSILDINEILSDYSHDIQEAITEEAERIAKEGQSKLKSTSPKNKKNTSHKGRYAKGWRVKTEKGEGYVNCTIHNATDWQLTHLLENEHLTRNGGKYTPKQKHIAPVHDECCSEFEKNVEEIIKNRG
ncbi:MAG: HK97 gp10 family phage protein [Ruminococcus sp.]|nr:HK97 gp10 family phage protein [Ruminococcus sp.]